jgi:hypothetical protein
LLKNNHLRTIVLIWAAWAVIIIGYQTLVDARMEIGRPDQSLEWTPDETARNSLKDRLYLNEPFMNRQVAWDSEYYLSIAVVGYPDDQVTQLTTRGGRHISLNYAFFPVYPFLMNALSVPLNVLGMNAIATATLAGVIISVVGTLAGMIALYDLTRDELEDAGGVRTAFYLLIFPSSFFLAQVYTEGLFVAFAFGSLALMRHRRLLLAGILAALATWTRSIGIALVIPLGIAWLEGVWKARNESSGLNAAFFKSYILPTLSLVLPFAAYLIWRQAVGVNFDRVEDEWFGRTLFDWDRFTAGIQFAWEGIIDSGNLQRRAYFLIEFGAAALGLIAGIFTLRRYPGIALFSLVSLLVAFTSGAPQGWVRFVVVVPALYIFLSRLGRSVAFDRAWTLASVLVMSLLTLLYTYDMWVA